MKFFERGIQDEWTHTDVDRSIKYFILVHDVIIAAEFNFKHSKNLVAYKYEYWSRGH